VCLPLQFSIPHRLDRAPRMAARSGRWIRPSLIADSAHRWRGSTWQARRTAAAPPTRHPSG
jgi:hypothetical protein